MGLRIELLKSRKLGEITRQLRMLIIAQAPLVPAQQLISRRFLRPSGSRSCIGFSENFVSNMGTIERCRFIEKRNRLRRGCGRLRR